MENLNKISKFFLFVSILSFILWLGGYLLRILLVYQLFEPKDLILKGFVTPENLPGMLFLLNTAVTLTFILFPAFIISLIIFLITSKVSLKKEGWLFISLLIILITMPFEIYLMNIDYKIIFSVLDNKFNADEVLQLYKKRITSLSSFSLIEIFSYSAIVFMYIFKPLQLKNK